MRTKYLFLGITGVCLVSSVAAIAQPYNMARFVVAGGGATSTGGGYSLTGTLGQHDAGGPTAAGGYSLTGGFWALQVVPTLGAPSLSIVLTATNTAVVFWPSPSAGWNIQVNTDLGATAWNPPAETVQDNGTTKFIVINPPTGNRFYRLRKP